MNEYTTEEITVTVAEYACKNCQFRSQYLAEMEAHIRSHHHQIVTRTCGPYQVRYLNTQEDAERVPPYSRGRGCYTWTGPGWYVQDYQDGELINKRVQNLVGDWHDAIGYLKGKAQMFEAFLADNPPPTKEE